MKILHLEDDPGDAELVRGIIVAEWPQAEIVWVATRFAYAGELHRSVFDVILSDFALPTFTGPEALELAKERAPDTPFIFLSGTIGEDRAMEALRSGAADYVLKDRLKVLNAAILRVQRESTERRKHRQAERLLLEQAEMLNQARLSINSDTTARKNLEEQFLRSQRMENVGLLAAGISHDLNNMLAPILLAAPMLREYLSDVRALALLGTLERSAERGANLVRQILSFVHGMGGEQRLFQVEHVLRDLAAVVVGTFPKSIAFEDSVPPDAWPIKGNPTQIHQVLLNLCVNARDAMPDGGRLSLRAENHRLDAATAGDLSGSYLLLQVEDTGTGIQPEVLQKMWLPFFTTKGPGKGTGLGLSTIRGIIENHNGFIQVTTELGRGSVFRIFLPAAEEGPVEGSNSPVGSLPRGNGELILVVDDEPQIREMTLAMLTRSGYRVLLAADGLEAAVIFAERAAEIRLVITDLHMPNLDGVMLGRALRRINPGVQMLVLSGMKAPLGNRPDYLPEEFGDDFLGKPFKPSALLKKVHALLGGGLSTGSRPPFED